MSAPSGRPDFFALEAGEYLQELGRALGHDTAPEASVVRVARALRGASLLAGPADFTRAAAALEAAIRAVVEGHAPWEPGLAELLRGGIETLTALLRHTREWTETASGQALHLAAEFEGRAREAGAPPPPPFGRRATDRSQPGVRAFLAREAAIVAGAVERLSREPGGIENPAALENVLRTTRPLRGVAFLSEVPPLGELLDLTEQLLRDPLRGVPSSPQIPHALGLLAASLARAAREITEDGTPRTDSAELSEMARRVREAAVEEGDVVSVEGLFADGDAEPIVHQGSPPVRELPGPDAALPMLALAARLTQAAELFSRDAPGPLRALQEIALLLTLRAGLPPRATLPVDRLVAAIARALGRAAPAANPDDFLRALRQAAAAISGLAEGAPDQGAPRVAMVTGLFETLPGDAPATTALEPAATVEPAAVQAQADELPLVNIETLLYADKPAAAADLSLTEDPIVAIADLAPDAPEPVLNALEASLHTYGRLLAGRAEPFLPATLPPTRSPAPPAAPRSEDALEDDEAVVPIETLLYRGRGALVRANEVRQEIDAIIAALKAERRLEPLIQELMDLVPLALDDAR
ncbi:MAG TPA: hypothetical protein VMK53_09955 [Gemmatimonadales bacterium]|nr:hypothetical protein [Gemmatimonadales bacterium]